MLFLLNVILPALSRSDCDMCSEALREEYCDVFPESEVCSKPCGFEWDKATRRCWEEGTLPRLGSSNGTQWQRSVSVCDTRAGVPCSTSGVLLGKAQSESQCYDMCIAANAKFCAFQVHCIEVQWFSSLLSWVPTRSICEFFQSLDNYHSIFSVQWLLEGGRPENGIWVFLREMLPVRQGCRRPCPTSGPHHRGIGEISVPLTWHTSKAETWPWSLTQQNKRMWYATQVPIYAQLTAATSGGCVRELSWPLCGQGREHYPDLCVAFTSMLKGFAVGACLRVWVCAWARVPIAIHYAFGIIP